MARRNYIYVVMATTMPAPAAAFTVKNELAIWLEHHSSHSFRVFRVRDGLSRDPEVTEIVNPLEVT